MGDSECAEDWIAAASGAAVVVVLVVVVVVAKVKEGTGFGSLLPWTIAAATFDTHLGEERGEVRLLDSR